MSLLLNIGSGQRKFEKPWINVDKQAKWEPDVLWNAVDVTNPCPFEPRTASIIVLHHMVEHLWADHARMLMETCRYLLQPGGSLLVFVPSMWELASMWKEGRMDDQLYFTNVYGAFMGSEADLHRWGYTRQTLHKQLTAAGFGVVIPFDWRRIEGADIAEGRWILGMEAFNVG